MTEQEIKTGLYYCNSTTPYACNECPYYHVDWCTNRLIDDATVLIDKQDKEIERLKADNKRFENNMRAVLEIEKKQAKIDALNELKEKYNTFGNTFPGWRAFISADDIDKMIEEIKNA